jgi:spore germination cell wall hydrolase CwlJ-like protein
MMRLLDLQRQLMLRFNRIPRVACLVLAAVTFCSALLLQVQSAGQKLASGENTGFKLELQAESLADEPEQELRYQPSDEELTLLARAVYSEARGEQFNGQVAVAAVILNRMEDPQFPDDVAGVIFQPQAFTAVSDGQFWMEPDQTAYQAVEEALDGNDPSSGALYYYNPVTATSWWIFTRPTITRIGRHLFAG